MILLPLVNRGGNEVHRDANEGNDGERERGQPPNLSIGELVHMGPPVGLQPAI